MKIKSVHELTNLSDRTIRYYIEQNLISPSYTENYLGRKAFDFSEKDIEGLKSIAVLRKFNFTIEEIRDIINDAETSKSILCNVKRRTEKTIADGQEMLASLSQLCSEKTYTLEELAEKLAQASLYIPAHNETIKKNIVKTILTSLKTVLIFAVVWLPVILSLSIVAISINKYHYPVFDEGKIALTIASFLPSMAVLIISKSKWSRKKIAEKTSLVLCILCIPASFILSFGIVSKSETTQFKNYRDFDANCLADRNVVFQELFPEWPRFFENEKQADGSYKTIYFDSHYYYRYYQCIDYTYDIYAEWPLETDSFDNEVRRASEVFEKAVKNRTYNNKFKALTKGDYNCLILYSGDEPFNKATNSYDYLIFAYNEKSKTVRYICCDSLENGADQPYYLLLDW